MAEDGSTLGAIFKDATCSKRIGNVNVSTISADLVGYPWTLWIRSSFPMQALDAFRVFYSERLSVLVTSLTGVVEAPSAI